MADHHLPLTRSNVLAAHARIKPHIHLTPVLTCTTLSTLASTPQPPEALLGTPFEGQPPANPKVNLFFKCENFQRIGAFKCRGAFHALSWLREEGGDSLARGVVTHSSGNHAQALALAARTHGCAAHIVMPRISTPAKIAATQALGAEIVFSGSTAAEREDVVKSVLERTGGVLVPPYDHEDIILGQGTVGVELEGQVRGLLAGEGEDEEEGAEGGRRRRKRKRREGQVLDAVVAPLGGGGLLSGIATAMEGTGTRVFGAEPSFQGADDGRRGLASGERVTSVSSLTIADGLRTPVGVLPWSVISDKEKVQGVFAVSEEQIKAAMRLVMERMKVVVEPSAAVGLAVVLYDEDFRRLVETEGGEEGWDVGVVLSGGNTTVEAVGGLFAGAGAGATPKVEREEGKMGLGGERVAENVAG